MWISIRTRIEIAWIKFIKNIKKCNWPKWTTKTNNVLKLLQTKICRLSLISSNEMAMELINNYSMNIVVKYIAINIITVQSGSTVGIDNL